MLTLVVNMLLEWETGDVERVLWIDPLGNDVVMIQVDDAAAWPTIHAGATLQDALEKQIVWTTHGDPYAVPSQSEEDIPVKHRQRRDQAWHIIQPLIAAGKDIFVAEKRGPLVAAVAEQAGKTKTTVYGYLRRYWQGGQTRNALLPRYHNCGAPDQIRPDTERKRGRPSDLERATGVRMGVNVDDRIRDYFRAGIRQFYETRQARSLKEAYQLTLEKFFHRGYEWQDGVAIPILPPAEELPTFRQFTYWYRKEQNLTRTVVSRKGERRFNSDHRALLGDSTQMAFGPGAVYQIDATIGDIYLVSALDRQRIIGKPIIYLVVDVFSRLIAGLSVSLEGPSWLGAMLALENATTDKVAFCAHYGLTISLDEWPSYFLPEMLLADRGELEGYNADNLVNALNIRVANTAPYRADMKGIVEQYFRLNNQRVIASLPGAVEHDRGRGDADYRLDASLDLRQFTYLMIQGALHHNRHHWIDDYPLDTVMVADRVTPYPLDLWHWGVRNRSGHLRTLPADVVRLNLLPQGQASITRRGILFESLLYSCDLAIQENWFVNARVQGRQKIPVAYDPRLTDVIYLHLDNGRRIEPCYLLDAQGMQLFRKQDWATTYDFFALQNERKQAAASRHLQAQAEFNAHKQHIVQQAQDQQDDLPDKPSKRARVQGIRDNRQTERDHERYTGAWNLASDAPENQDDPPDETGYIPPAQYLDELQ
jgi:putative transposase